ncbi:hypothetical protein MKW92_036802 [Papaver armeniacum]|nr:hypothetical protein MKW92_036802 [Papaver armeniacum]
MARANMIGWAMLLVAVMALYVGKAEAWPCQLDCAREHAQEQGGSVASHMWECFGACFDHSITVKAEPSAETQKVIEFLAQAPESEKYPSVGRKAFPPSRQPMIDNISSIGIRKAFSPPKQPMI